MECGAVLLNPPILIAAGRATRSYPADQAPQLADPFRRFFFGISVLFRVSGFVLRISCFTHAGPCFGFRTPASLRLSFRMHIRAVIFDMDGLMIDTDTPYWAAGREVARRYGKEVADATLGRMMGRSPIDSMRGVRDGAGDR